MVGAYVGQPARNASINSQVVLLLEDESMNRSFLFSASFWLMTLAAVSIMHTRAEAQEGQAKFVTEASIRLTRLVATSNKDGYTLQDNSFSIGGGWLKQSKEKWVPLYSLKLVEGKKYLLIAAGDEDAKDVDLEIVDADGKRVALDDKTDPEAVVDFVPKASGTYQVRIRLYESMNNVPCVCLSVVLTRK